MNDLSEARKNVNWECFKAIMGGLMLLTGSLAGCIFAVSKAGSTDLTIGWIVGAVSFWGYHLWDKGVSGE